MNKLNMKGMRIVDLERRLTKAILDGDSTLFLELEKEILRKEKKKKK